VSEPILSPDELEIVPGFNHEKLQGWVPSISSEDELREALEKAFDYRGDVTITRKDGTQVEGYLFDRRQTKTLSESSVRILPANGTGRVSIPYSDVAALSFSGGLGCREKLGSLGAQVLGEESGGGIGGD